MELQLLDHQTRSVRDMMKMWVDIGKSVIASPRRSGSSFYPVNTANFKPHFNWFPNIQDATHIECEYFVAKREHQTYRRNAITIFARNAERYKPNIPPNHAIFKHLDAWCTEAFGRSYRKPGSRWKRGQRADSSLVNNTYFFKDKADAAAFKFYWHQAQLSEQATVLNGTKLEY
ncbi:hypothetical protein D3C87_650830 [compost metagenome]